MLFPGSPKLRLAGMLCALALAGCGSGKVGGNGYAIFTWGIYDIEDSADNVYDYPLTCAETGAASVVVTLMNQATGTLYTQEPVPCSAGQISTSDVPAGSYTVGFDLYGDPAVYGNATTLLDSFDATETYRILRGANDFRSQYAPYVVQSFVMGWSFRSGPAASYCGVFGAQYVDLDFLAEGSSTWVTSRLSCTSGQGASFPIPYPLTQNPLVPQWQLVLVNAAEEELALIPGPVTPVSLPLDRNVNLGTQIFNL